MPLNTGNRTINASKNALSAFANKICMLILHFISRKFFIKYIGVAYLGINGLFSNVLTLLSMADLGLGTAINVSLYKPIAQNDTKKINALMNFYKQVYRYIALGVAIIGFGLIPFLKYIVNMEKNIPHLYLYYCIYVVKTVCSYLLIYKSAIIKADQKAYKINQIEIYTHIVKVILQIVIIIVFKNYLLYLLLEVAQVITHNIVVTIVADKQYSFIDNNEQLPKEEKKSIFSEVSSVFIYKVSTTLINGTDNIIMSIICGTIAVGYYSNYYTISHNLETMIGLIFTSLTAGIGNLVATENSDKRYETFKTMQLVSFWICAISVVCLICLTQDFVVLWIGKDMLLDNLVVMAIAWNTYFSMCMRPIWTFRAGTGMYKKIRYIMFATSALNIILSIILGKLLGMAGILFATSISKVCTYFWYEPNILFRDFFNRSAKEYYFEHVNNLFLIGICIIVCKLAMRLFTQNTIFLWIVKALICLTIVCIVYLIRYFRTKEFKNVLTKIRFLFKKSILRK